MMKRPFLVLSGAFVFGEVCCAAGIRVSWILPAVLMLPAMAVLIGHAVGKNGRFSGSVWLFWVWPVFFLAGMFRLTAAFAWSPMAVRAMTDGAELPVCVVCQVDEIRSDGNTVQFYTRTISEMTEPDSGAPVPFEDPETEHDKTDDQSKDRTCRKNICSGAVVVLRTVDGQAAGLRVGDRIRGSGTFQLFEAASNFGQFDFRDYYKALGLEGRIELSGWERLPGRTQWCANVAWQMKQFLLGRLSAAAGEDAGLLSAILTGDKSGLTDQDKKLFQENGISHIYAVSGLHASFVGRGIYRLLQKMGGSRRLCSVCACTALGLLMLMAGGGVSVQRAFVMFGLMLAAGLTGRTYDLPVGAAAAGLLILWERPLMLFQSGFHLSFCAVAGIAAVSGITGQKKVAGEPKTKKTLYREPDRTFIHRICLFPAGRSAGQGQMAMENLPYTSSAGQLPCVSRVCKSTVGLAGNLLRGLTVSMWIQLALLPATLWHFFQYPVYGILLNLIVIPLLPVVLALGFLSVAVSCIRVSGGQICLLPVHMIFRFWRMSCRAARGLPGAVRITGRPESVMLCVFCLFLVCFRMYSVRKEWGGRKWYPGCLLVVLALSLVFLSRNPEPGLQVTFLDMGQGDGIYLREESGYTIMIDGGSSDVKRVGENRLLPMLKASGCSRVDDWFLSHPDQDHLSGLKELLEEGFPVKRLWIATVFQSDETVDVLREMAMKNGTKVCVARPGCLLSGSASGFSLTCLAPEEGQTVLSANDGSMVLMAEYQGIRLLFPGDLEMAGERRLLSAYDKAPDGQQEYKAAVQGTGALSCHVLKVGHHGSKGSTGADFLSAVHPVMAVISCGRENRYGHPHTELLSRLETECCRTVVTAETGAVTVWIAEGNVSFSTFGR